MPITSSAKKAVLVSKRRFAENQLQKTAYKQALKNAKKAVLAQDAHAATLIIQAQSKLDRAVKSHLMHRNTASRLLSRLSKHAPAAAPTKKRAATKTTTKAKKSPAKKT